MTAKALSVRSTPVGSTLADRLVEMLRGQGIDTYFGVPGGAIEPLLNAVARAQALGKARFVGTRGEAAAGFAADGYFRETARLAVCLSTTGPGATNLVTSVMSADADRVPMLVLTPQVPASKQGRGALQDSSPDAYDVAGIFRAVTRYSTTITHPDQLRVKLAHALLAATSGRRGPVHLSIPSDVLSAACASMGEVVPTIRAPKLSDRAALVGLAECLTSARRVVVYVGDHAGAPAARVYELAAQLDWEVVTSPGGKRWVSHTDARYMGVLGFSGHHSAHRAVEEAECVLAIGASFDELSTNGWSTFGSQVIHAVDSHWDYALRLPRVNLVLCDTDELIEELLSRLPVPSSPRREQPKRPSSVPPSNGGEAVHPVALLEWLNVNLGQDVVLHADAGNSFSWTTRFLRRTEPNTYRVAMGASSMCWAISASLGAAIGSGRRCVCLTGDGAMLMSSCELSTAAQHRLPVTYVILNDGGFGMVRHGQRMGGAELVGHDFSPTRFDLLAQACGATGIRVHGLAELERLDVACLRSAEGGTIVIDVLVDCEAVPPIYERVKGLLGVVN